MYITIASHAMHRNIMHAWEKARYVCLCQNSISMELLNHIQTIINMHARCLQSRATVQPCMQTLILGIVHAQYSHCAPSSAIDIDKIVSECVYSVYIYI